MEIEVVEQEKNRIKFIVHGAGHTFCNNLKRELYAHKDVDAAAYTIDHPLVGKPTFIIESKGAAKFNTILKDAVSSIKKSNKDFKSAVAKAA